jgi:hypothetical protein
VPTPSGLLVRRSWLCCAVRAQSGQARYIKNFVGGPFDFGEPELDASGDVSTTPRYFVKVTGSKAIETGIQQITTRKRAGVETGRSVSAGFTSSWSVTGSWS